MDFIKRLKSQIKESKEKTENQQKYLVKNINNNPQILNKVTVNSLDISNLITGEIIENELGKCFLVEERLPNDYKHGSIELKKFTLSKSEVLKNLITEQIDFDYNDLLFLDTETTGLSTGTGTIAFLVGVGYFNNDLFILKQFFVRDFDEEFAMLFELKRIIDSKPIIISFNGKAFDWNLLSTRFLLNRIKLRNSQKIHLDLLHTSRIIWKRILDNCRLVSIEENILHIYREDDIPGMLIPSVYFKYLETKDATKIIRVLKHNKLDILSMVGLSMKIINLIEKPIKYAQNYFEIIGIGILHEKFGELNKTEELYNYCILAKDKYIKIEAYKKMTNLLKRLRKYEQLESCLEEMIKLMEYPTINSLIELSKCYEHRKKDYQKALVVINNALEVVSKFNSLKNMYNEELNLRKNRILRKINKNQ